MISYLYSMNKNSWTHIIWDLYECDFDYFINKNSHEYIKAFFEQKIKDAGFKVIWSMMYIFENQSFSFNIMLSESHLCIHTWPENNYISIDIFVCNYSRDNSEIAKKLFDEIIENFKSKRPKINVMKR